MKLCRVSCRLEIGSQLVTKVLQNTGREGLTSYPHSIYFAASVNARVAADWNVNWSI